MSQFAIAFAVAKGANVFVTSGSEEKIQKSTEAGTKAGFNYKDPDWVKQARAVGGFDAIIDSVGGKSINDYLKLVKVGGKIVVYGGTTERRQTLIFPDYFGLKLQSLVRLWAMIRNLVK